MTAKEFVLKHKPTAKAERQTTNGGEKYYLIREKGQYMYFSEGETESKAWTNARKKIEENAKVFGTFLSI